MEKESMRKDLITHFTFLVSYFIFVSLYKGWFDVIYLQFWLGGIIGTLLPDVDHLLYVYVLRPYEVTSQRAQSMLGQRQALRTWDLLAATRQERKDLIFHSAHFQLIFIAFTLLVVTSTGSLFGRGLVIAFLLHLLIDQVVDLMEVGNIKTWFNKINIALDREQERWYVLGQVLLLIIFGFFF